MSGPENNPRDDEEMDREQWERYEKERGRSCVTCGHGENNHWRGFNIGKAHERAVAKRGTR
jgi:hypothetical protein